MGEWGVGLGSGERLMGEWGVEWGWEMDREIPPLGLSQGQISDCHI